MFFFSSRRRHTRCSRDWSSDVCSSDLATANMAAWLEEKYALTPPEVAEVLGTSAEYKVSEVADRNAGVVLKINKEHLQTLRSEERRVGKEWRCRGGGYRLRTKSESERG